ncbi:Probable E3 ubiquitin-protein ligase ipaH7.8 (Probable RING-type E3 ubiquitin transferase ipaH7.8) [Durusdinium trenchii]|uniref:Probable E3 ubiquitin-protein ligase ipaH7.8 (Probable RING-type E3 ubiquitin transferase ipaH7.8) n=1 Tax=Durusdinium trenchii TaxID=1381693 RepID=A0ABP0HEM4_9DINO
MGDRGAGLLGKLLCKPKAKAKRAAASSVDRRVDPADEGLEEAQEGGEQVSPSVTATAPPTSRRSSARKSWRKSIKQGIEGLTGKGKTQQVVEGENEQGKRREEEEPEETEDLESPQPDRTGFSMKEGLDLIDSDKMPHVVLDKAFVCDKMLETDSFFRLLSKDKVHALTLADVTLSSPKARRLGEAMSKNSALELVTLRGVDPGGYEALAALLEGCNAAKEMRLQGALKDTTGTLVTFTGSHTTLSTGVTEFGPWSTALAKHVALESGKWYYEVTFEEVPEHEHTQIGWATPDFNVQSFVEGTGDDPNSWAFDGRRQSSWFRGEETAWGARFEQGDVLQLAVDFDSHTISFGHNGSFETPMGQAFEFPEGVVLKPAITAGNKMRLRINLGQWAFQYPIPEDHCPVTDWIEDHQAAGLDLVTAKTSDLVCSAALSTLDLSGNGLSASLASRMLLSSRSSQGVLRELDLSKNAFRADGFNLLTDLLHELPLLERLDLGCNKLGTLTSASGDMDALAGAIKNVLEAHEHLAWLSLRENGLGAEFEGILLAIATAHSKLRHVDLSENAVSMDVAVALLENGALQTLGLAGVGLDAIDAVAVAPSIERLDLGNNKLSVASVGGLVATIAGLGADCALRELNLNNNGLGDSCAEALGNLMEALPRLRALQVGGNDLGAQAVEALVKAAGNHTGLRRLSLDDNNLEVDDCAPLLQSFPRLVDLSLAGNSIMSLRRFANSLATHRSLRSLDLSRCKLPVVKRVKRDYLELLVKSLHQHLSMRELRIGEMGLDADDFEAICHSLEGHDLDALDLSKNRAGYQGVLHLFELLQRDVRLKRLSLEGISYCRQVEHTLEKLVQCNPKSRVDLLLDVFFKPLEDGGGGSRWSLSKRFSRQVSQDRLWSSHGKIIAEAQFTTMVFVVDWVSAALGIDRAKLLRVNGGVNFRHCRNPVHLPPEFKVVQGELGFDQCKEAISIPPNLEVDRYVFFANCEGPVQIGAGLKVKDQLNVEGVPGLTALPENMEVLGGVYLANLVHLSSIPESLVQGDEDVLFVHNCPQITTIPRSLIQTPRRIFLSGTGVSLEEFSRLLTLAHPGVEWRYGLATQRETLEETFRDLSEAVQFWQETAGDDEPSPLAQDLAEHVDTYYRDGLLGFLAKLRLAKEFEIREMRAGLAKRVIEVLEAICNDELARESLLIRINDSIDACGDKPIWALNQMATVLLASRARGKREELRELGRGLMRLGIIHEHAKKKVEKIRGGGNAEVDEICVYLGFEVAAREQLNLPVSSRAMLFPNYIRITEEDLKNAIADAEAITEEQFEVWLSTWPEWNRQLRKEAAESMPWEKIEPAKVPKRVSISLTTFLGDPMEQPVLLGKAGPWDYRELCDRWIETGIDFNNMAWTVEDFLEGLGRLEPAQQE